MQFSAIVSWIYIALCSSPIFLGTVWDHKLVTTYSWPTALRNQFVDAVASKLQKEEQEIPVSGPYGQYLHFVFIAHKK